MGKFALMTAALAAGASAATIPTKPIPTGAPKLDLHAFESMPVHTISLSEITDMVLNQVLPPKPELMFSTMATAATCSNPKVRTEWHQTTDQTKQNFVDSLKCLLGKPSKGNYPGSKNRYEDFVQVHQVVTDNVHNNRKFIVWHRAFLWAFEQTLEEECGFTEGVPWFDETKYAGRYSQSSIFSSKWFGGINLHGNCVSDGVSQNGP